MISVLSAVGLLVGACAQKEERVREKKSDIRIRAPYTRVDIDLPDEEDDSTRVDVDVDD